MPAPSRLRSIDPDVLAREVGRVLVQHRAALAPGSRDVEVGDPCAFPAARAIGNLARYAQQVDASSPPEVIEAAARAVVADLYSAPADLLPGAPALDVYAWAERIEGDHDVAVVLRAALARARIADGRDVPASWIADLGVPLDEVAAALASGELAHARVLWGRRRVAFVAADYASAWLAARGVFAAPAIERKGRAAGIEPREGRPARAHVGPLSPPPPRDAPRNGFAQWYVGEYWPTLLALLEELHGPWPEDEGEIGEGPDSGPKL